MSIREDLFAMKVRMPHGDVKGKKEKQPLEHSRLVSRLYEFFIRQMNCLIMMFIGVGFCFFSVFTLSVCRFVHF
jgi:hypothetical protein